MKYIQINYKTELGGSGELLISEEAYNNFPKLRKSVDKILHPAKKKVQVVVISTTGKEIDPDEISLVLGNKER